MNLLISSFWKMPATTMLCEDKILGSSDSAVLLLVLLSGLFFPCVVIDRGARWQYTRPRMEALLLFVQHVSSFKHRPLIYCKVLHPVVGLNPTLMSICVLNHHGKLTTTSLYLILRTFVCFHGNFCLWNYIAMNIIMWMNATMYHIRFAADGELFRAMCKEEDECRSSPANWIVKSRFWIQTRCLLVFLMAVVMIMDSTTSLVIQH